MENSSEEKRESPEGLGKHAQTLSSICEKEKCIKRRKRKGCDSLIQRHQQAFHSVTWLNSESDCTDSFRQRDKYSSHLFSAVLDESTFLKGGPSTRLLIGLTDLTLNL